MCLINFFLHCRDIKFILLYMHPARDIKRIAADIVKGNPVIIDTETTGLGSSDEIIEISAVDINGNVIVDTLLNASCPIPLEATNVHGIKEKDIVDAPTFDIVWRGQLEEIFKRRTVCTYNIEFDIKMIKQSLKIYGIRFPSNVKTACIMKMFAEYRGVWDNNRNHFKWFRLEAAAGLCGIEIKGNLHRALEDAQLARQVLLCMAQ